ncbi:MAG: VOC family protein [Ilumatobacteraceae bacterium]
MPSTPSTSTPSDRSGRRCSDTSLSPVTTKARRSTPSSTRRASGRPYWFQQMDEPRPQRNRIHIDVTVPHDVAEQRIGDALAAGGTLVSDARANAFWVLADPEGNEACVCTWQDRD